MEKAKVNINNEKLRVSSELLRALVHPLRLQILQYIDRQGPVNVNNIYSGLNLEQSITSQHLRILRQAGLVLTDRDGKFVHYRINYDKVGNSLQAIDNFFDAAEEG
jgi:DNA-binding transcriptional ArsR family regulator